MDMTSSSDTERGREKTLTGVHTGAHRHRRVRALRAGIVVTRDMTADTQPDVPGCNQDSVTIVVQLRRPRPDTPITRRLPGQPAAHGRYSRPAPAGFRMGLGHHTTPYTEESMRLRPHFVRNVIIASEPPPRNPGQQHSEGSISLATPERGRTTGTSRT